ncbi:hypothetical protein [Brevundimonas sp.]|uniref:hypothetical protein n=1 Tax=Brevundimonas sp. TaxID=1871086 RepID=UPI002D585F51|nr:hypothetical protein [Brevundimonas sp.]HYD26484.1 hypothetical protein [Brevundimonas sp.]
MTFRACWAAALSLAAAILATPAAAQSGFCGVSGSTAAAVGTYNPFSPTGLDDVSISLNLHRHRGEGFTRSVRFFLVEPAVQTPLEIRYRGWDITHSIFYAPRLAFAGADFGIVAHDFGGGGQPDTASILLTVSVPPGVDLPAGETISFDMIYVCEGQSGLRSVTTPRLAQGAVTVQIEVASALQASYAGPPLDFGDIGGMTDLQASAQVRTGAIRVASSGPYRVSIASNNQYRMAPAGGDPDDPRQRISYMVSFNGQAAGAGQSTALRAECRRSGLAGRNLPLSVRLQEGGEDKVASPDYRDTLIVTVTPLAAHHGGPLATCG